ncbi:MAG TPA: hypothetical protein VGE07_19630 [Herpetosiphonaceae bacterium]
MPEQHGWRWAELTDQHLELIHQAEATLGADYVLAYQPADSADPAAQAPRLAAAPLTASQLECLAGLESMIQAVIVAYSDQPGA